MELLNCGIICYIAPPGILRAFRFPILFLWRVSGGFGAKGNVTNNSTIPQFHANFSFGPFGVPFRSKCTFYQPKGPKSQKEVRIREIGNLKSRLVPPTPPQKCSMAVWQKPHTAIAAWHIAFLPAGWPETHTAMLHFSSSPRPLQSYVFVAFPPSVNCGIVELWNYLLQCPPRNSQSFPTSKLFSWEGLGGGWGQGQCNK